MNKKHKYVITTNNRFLHLQETDSESAVKGDKCGAVQIDQFTAVQADQLGAVQGDECCAVPTVTAAVKVSSVAEVNSTTEVRTVDEKISDAEVSSALEVSTTVNFFDKVMITKTRKRKCRKCGYKGNCHLKSNCRSREKICYSCLKSNHYPKSQDCKVRRQRKKYYLCQQEAKITMENRNKKEENNSLPDDIIRLINDRILLIEDNLRKEGLDTDVINKSNDQVEEFIKLSINSTHFLENFVTIQEHPFKEVSNKCSTVCDKMMKHKQNIKVNMCHK